MSYDLYIYAEILKYDTWHCLGDWGESFHPNGRNVTKPAAMLASESIFYGEDENLFKILGGIDGRTYFYKGMPVNTSVEVLGYYHEMIGHLHDANHLYLKELELMPWCAYGLEKSNFVLKTIPKLLKIKEFGDIRVVFWFCG